MTRPRPPVLTLIGHTPLLPLHFPEAGRTLYAKAEFLNPSGSIKDRLALAIIEDAEDRGLLRPDSIILECTSGNTGISLAMVGAAKGYRVKILMSESASVERRHLIRQLGGEVQLFAANRGYATGIALSLELADDEAPAPADPARMEQLIGNPVSNAIKFTETGGVTVDMQSGVDEADNPTLDVCVTDTGIGMTPEQVDRVFNEFEQAEATTSRRYGGTGLGLAVVKAVARAHQGDVQLRSRPGRGTCAILSLPLLGAVHPLIQE